jgi:hypothetical protein
MEVEPLHGASIADREPRGRRPDMSFMTRIDGWVDRGLSSFFESTAAEDADRLFPALGPEEVERGIRNPNLSPAARARLVEVALVRGGRKNRTTLEHEARIDLGRRFDHEAIRWQKIAVLAMTPEIFVALSAEETFLGREGLHPATRWIETAMQPRGWLDIEQAAAWMKALPPEVRGRATFHLHDAAHEAAKGSVRVSSAKLGVGPVDVEIDWVPRDSEWAQVVKQVGGAVKKDLDRRPAERDAFVEGIRLGSISAG